MIIILMYICICNAVTERDVRESPSEAVGECNSRELLESILGSEEEHIDFLETQLDPMQKVGVQKWLQTQSG